MVPHGGGERGVGAGSQGVDGVIRGGGQFAEKPVEVGAWIDAPAQAAAKEAVEDVAALTGPGVSNEASHPRGISPLRCS